MLLCDAPQPIGCQKDKHERSNLFNVTNLCKHSFSTAWRTVHKHAPRGINTNLVVTCSKEYSQSTTLLPVCTALDVLRAIRRPLSFLVFGYPCLRYQRTKYASKQQRESDMSNQQRCRAFCLMSEARCCCQPLVEEYQPRR